MPDLDVALVIRGQDRSQGAIRSARRGLDSYRDGLQRIQRVAAGVLIGGGVLETLRRGAAVSIRSFSAVEDGLVGVAKTADLTAAQVAQLDRRLSRLSLDPSIGLARPALLEIAQAAGQLGVKGVDDLTRFTATIAKLQGATDLVGAEGATSLARILNVTGEGPERIDRLGSVIVRLGNNFAATESEITRAATRVATATARYPVSSAQAAALGAALKALGIEAEAGGTAVGRGFGAIDAALRGGGEGAQRLSAITGRSIAELRQAFGADAVGVFQEFVEALASIHEQGGDVAGALEDIGIEGERAIAVYGTLATQTGVLGRALSSASDEVERNTALNEEALRAAGTFSRQLQLVRNEIDIQAAELGGVLAPALLTAAQNWDVLGFAAAGAAGRLAAVPVRGLLEARRDIRADRAALLESTRLTVQQATARRAEAAATLAAAEAQRRYQLSLLRQAATNPLASAAFNAQKLTAATAQLRTARAADAAATAAQTAAQSAHNATVNRGTLLARGLRGALGFLGGPIGIITTALTLGATAWALFGRSASDAAAATGGVVDPLQQTLDELDERLQRLDILSREQERIFDDINDQGALLERAAMSNSTNPIAARNLAERAAAAYERGTRALNQLVATEEEYNEVQQERNRVAQQQLDRGPVQTPEEQAERVVQQRAAQETADRLADIARRSNDALAQLSLDRISLVNRAERQSIAELLSLENLSVAQEQVRQRAVIETRRAAQLERQAIFEEDIDAERTAAQARQREIEQGLQAEIDAEQRVLDARTAAREAATALVDRGALALATPYERAIDAIDRWEAATREALDEAGAATEQYTRLAEISAERRARADEEETDRRLRASTDWRDGVTRALEDVRRRTEDYAGLAEGLISGAFDAAGDAVENFVRTGKLEFGNFVEDTLAQFARLATQRLLLNLLSGALVPGAAPGLAFPSGSLGHSGLVAGQLGGVRRSVHPDTFIGAPRFQGGGVVGDEVPAILHRGEVVFTPAQLEALGEMRGPSIVIEFTNQGTPQRQVDRDVQFDGKRYIIGIVTDDIESGGSIGRSIRRQGAVS